MPPIPPDPDLDPSRIVELDLRDLPPAALAHAPRVHEALATLRPDGVLHLRTTVPADALVARLARDGFAHRAAAFADDDHSTWFWKGTPPTIHPRPTPDGTPAPDGVMDLRRLAPPEPMLRIVERLERGEADFEVLLPWYPGPLVAVAARYGCVLRTLDSAPDRVLLRVERREPPDPAA